MGFDKGFRSALTKEAGLVGSAFGAIAKPLVNAASAVFKPGSKIMGKAVGGGIKGIGRLTGGGTGAMGAASVGFLGADALNTNKRYANQMNAAISR